MKARTDPGMVTVMKALLGLWHSKQVAGYFSHVSFQKVANIAQHFWTSHSGIGLT